jgi:hypothetical protein
VAGSRSSSTSPARASDAEGDRGGVRRVLTEVIEGVAITIGGGEAPST